MPPPQHSKMSRVGTMQPLACEACRKRKVRCSGTTPCSNCQKHMTECYFELNRRRRGPRPKPRPLTENQLSTERAAANASHNSTPPPIIAPRVETQPVQPPTAWIGARTPPFSLNKTAEWKKGILKIIGSDSYMVNDEVMVSVDETLHLILIFCTTVNSQQCPIVSPVEFLSRLEKGAVGRHSLYAISASSARFSRHGICRAAQLAEAFAIDARGTLASTHGGTDAVELDRILTLSVLSLHEAYQGNGLQACYDLTGAMSSAASLQHSSSHCGNANSQAALETIQRYLQTLGTLLSIGHSIQPMGLSSYYPTSDALSTTASDRGPSRSVLPQLLALSHRILSWANKDVTSANPAPWSKESGFMGIKRSLDKFYILHSTELSSCAEVLESLKESEAGAGELVLCSSLFHANTILLNRIFLPVGLLPAVSERSHEHSKSRRKLFFFPAAAPTFWKERVAACVSSARNAVQLCTAVLDQGMFLLSPMLGYTLYLSGLVFLNQLQVEVNPGYRSDHISNLKIVFTVLGAMRQFYTPAYVWTETLLHVHSAEPISEAVALAHSPSSLFTSFMARFPDIKEPPFCPMNQSDIRAIRHQMEQTVTAGVVDENDDRNRTQITKVRSGAMGLDVQHEVSIDDDDDDDDPEYAGQSSVLDGYSRALEDAIENMVDPTEDSIFSPQMVSQQQPRQESAIAQVTRAIVSHSRVNGHTNELNPSRDIHETLDQNISEMDFSIPSFELPNSTLTAAEAMMSLFLEPQNIDMDLSLDLECAEDIDHGGAFLDRELWLPQLQ